jgi:hypothetical protein
MSKRKQTEKSHQNVVYVEHVIGRVKVYRIIKDFLRSHKFGIDDFVMQIACALVNYKLSIKISSIAV